MDGKYGDVTSLLFQVHLAEPLMLFRFLCVLWGHSSNRDNQLDVDIDAILQTQALSMGEALLAKQPTAVLEELAAAYSPGEKPLRRILPHQQFTTTYLFDITLHKLIFLFFLCLFLALVVFPSLLCCLSSPVEEVRRVSLGALQSLSRARASPFWPIMEKLLRTTDELLADPSYLSQVRRRSPASGDLRFWLLTPSVCVCCLGYR